VEERERLLRGRIEMRGKDQGRGGAWGGHGRQGHAGRAGPGRAGLGWVGPGWAAPRGKTPVARTTTDWNSIREAKSETELSDACD
jgi:hypothetical protein